MHAYLDRTRETKIDDDDASRLCVFGGEEEVADRHIVMQIAAVVEMSETCKQSAVGRSVRSWHTIVDSFTPNTKAYDLGRMFAQQR